MLDLTYQLIGFLGLLAFIISYQYKDTKKLFLFQLIGVSLFAVQFIFLNAFSGCFSLILIAVRNAMMTKYNEWKWIRNKIWPLILCVLFTIILYITWAGPISLFAYTASIVSTVFYWTNNARNLRLANLLICCPCWIAYDCIVGSLGGIASESLAMISIVISFVRFGWNNLCKN